MDVLFLAVGQLAVGLIIACTLLLGYAILLEYIHGVLWRRRHPLLRPNIAEIKREGAWQYNDDFFNKVEEFRSDFT